MDLQTLSQQDGFQNIGFRTNSVGLEVTIIPTVSFHSEFQFVFAGFVVEVEGGAENGRKTFAMMCSASSPPVFV